MARRMLKVLLPEELIAAARRAVGDDGYPSLADLVEDAIEQLIADLEELQASEDAVVDEPIARHHGAGGERQSTPQRSSRRLEPQDVHLDAFDEAAVRSLKGRGRPLQLEPDYGPLDSFHNRSFPTIWAASRLVTIWAAEGDPVALNDFVEQVLADAWEIGIGLDLYQHAEGRSFSVSARWPTNPDLVKRRAVETGFRTHVLGSAFRLGGSAASVRGPLFALGLVDVFAASRGEVAVAPSSAGLDLLQELRAARISADYPHSQSAWDAFSLYLADHWAEERQYLELVLSVVDKGPSPKEFEGHIRRAIAKSRPEAFEVDTFVRAAPGYLARSREWGLVEPRPVDRRYALTDRGREALASRLRI